MKKYLICIFVLFAFIFSLQASPAYCLPGVAKWKAVWDANSEPDVEGYYLYWREVGGEFSNDNRQQIEGREVTEISLDFLQEGTWELAVTAYDKAGNESEFSNVVSFVKDNSAPGAVINFKLQLVISVQ